MMIREKPNVFSAKAHFSFGNDEWVCKSSYEIDYGMMSKLHTYRTFGKPKPQLDSRILPEVEKGSEKWASSTMVDYSGFNNESRKRAYDTSRCGYKAAKSIQTNDNGLLKDNHALPHKTAYNTDFRQPSIYLPEMETIMDVSQNSLRKYHGKRNVSMVMISEARQAFQWPSSDRIKLPLHLNPCKA